MTPEQRAVLTDTLEQAGFNPDQIRRAIHAAELDPEEVALRIARSEYYDLEAQDSILLKCIDSEVISEAFRNLERWYA